MNVKNFDKYTGKLNFIGAILILVTYISLMIFLPDVLKKPIEFEVFGFPVIFNGMGGLLVMIIFLILIAKLNHLEKKVKELNQSP